MSTNLTAPPPKVHDPLRPCASEVVECPVCGCEIDIRVAAFGSQVDDVEIAACPCGHDNDPLIVESLFIERVQELGRAAYLRRFE